MKMNIIKLSCKDKKSHSSILLIPGLECTCDYNLDEVCGVNKKTYDNECKAKNKHMEKEIFSVVVFYFAPPFLL